MPRALLPLTALLLAFAAVLPSALPAHAAAPGLPPFCWLAGSEHASEISPGGLAFLEGECAPDTGEQAALSAGAGTLASVPTGTVSPDRLVNNPAADTPPHTTQSETTIVSCGGTTLAAWNDSGSTDVGTFTGYARSTNGGNTWTDLGVIPGPTGSDPVLAADSDCRFYFSAIGTLDGCGALIVVRSDDGGLSWRAPVNAALNLPCGDFHDKEWMAVDTTGGAHDGNVYVCWDDRGLNRIDLRISRSVDGAASFSSSTVLSTFSGGFATGCQVRVAPNGHVHVVWSEGNDLSLRIRTSTNGGVSFGVVTIISPTVRVGAFGICGTSARPLLNGDIRAFNWPSLAVHPQTGSLHVVWNDAGGDGADILYTRSFDGGKTWSAPLRLNDDATATDQFQPAIGFNADGAVRAFWLDRRLDPADNLLFDVFSTVSFDEGDTFGLNERISDVSSGVPPINPNFDSTITHCYMGDYNQVVGAASDHYMVWSDNRNKVGARPDPDVFFDKRKSVPPPSSVSVTVTRTDDPQPGPCVPSDCSLREAIIASNSTVGPDIVTLPAGNYVLSRAGRGEDEALTGDLDIKSDLTLKGAGADLTTISGGALDRVLDLFSPANVAIRNLRVKDGSTDGATPGPPPEGGGIRNGGTLSLSGASVDGNVAARGGAGGGIYNTGTLVIEHSILYSNVATSLGGGIHNAGTLSIVNSTVHGNESQTVGGGGISNGGTASLNAVTIAGNRSATAGANLRNLATGDIDMRNTIVAGSDGPSCNGAIVSLGHNLDDDGSCGLDAPGDLPGTDALLGKRGKYGGPTLSVRLRDDSPAIDSGDPAFCPLADQRGFIRPVEGDNDADAVCDIGAFELGSLPLGDVDCSLKTNTLDARAMLVEIAGLGVTGCGALVGDVNCDGVINGADVLAVLRYIAALPDVRPAGCPPFAFG